MDRNFYLELARSGLRMPIGADLVLHEHAGADEIRLDGGRLGRVVAETARRYGTPLAVPLMDLTLEKADLLAALGIDSGAAAYHFEEPPGAETLGRLRADAPFPARNLAHFGSVGYIARETELTAAGMAIGPFSLMTKLMNDPITPLALAARGVTAEDDPGVRTAEACLELAEWAVHRSVRAQLDAGARAVLICEPAANIVYISPRRFEAGGGVFERFVMQPGLRLKALLESRGAALVLHDCGELIPQMVREFAVRLHPAILSLGSSRKLWEDAALVPPDVVLFGNLPTKNFYCDDAMPDAKVEALTLELVARMRETGHPFILGSECDVLHVDGSAAAIRRKVELMLACGRTAEIASA